MTYHVAILILRNGGWAETMGDHDKECVDFEIECWKDQHARGTYRVCRASFKRTPTQRQLDEWGLTEEANALKGWAR